MDIVERLRKSGNWEWEIENICGEAADEIERLRKELKSVDERRHEAVCNLMVAGCDIGDLVEVLREVADAHGTGKQGAGSWLDKVHQALEVYE